MIAVDENHMLIVCFVLTGLRQFQNLQFQLHCSLVSSLVPQWISSIRLQVSQKSLQPAKVACSFKSCSKFQKFQMLLKSCQAQSAQAYQLSRKLRFKKSVWSLGRAKLFPFFKSVCRVCSFE